MNPQMLGWTPELDTAFLPHAQTGLVPVRVARVDAGGHYRLLTLDGVDLPAVAAGRLRAAAKAGGDAPVVGDWAAAAPSPGDAPWAVHALLPRRTLLARRSAGPEGRPQPMAANVDVLAIVAGLDAPLNRRRIERYLALALAAGVDPLLVLNKRDLAPAADPAGGVAGLPAGVPVLQVSARDGSGLEALRAFLAPGRTVAFLGPSGVGKSSLVNALAGDGAAATGTAREKDRKGRHTTTQRELILIPGGGLVLDTPGMRELGLLDADEGVRAVFQDVDEAAKGCRFRDCRHDTEPGCAVRAALAAGLLDAARWEHYRKLRREAEAEARRADERETRAAGRRGARMVREALERKRRGRE